MALKGKIKGHHVAIGIGAAVAIGFLVWKSKKGGGGGGIHFPSFPHLGGMPHPAAMANLGYTGMTSNPGLSQEPYEPVDQWVAAGHSAGLNPSAFSNLTQKNDDYFRNGVKHSLPYIPLMGGKARSFEGLKFQGSEGFTIGDPHVRMWW